MEFGDPYFNGKPISETLEMGKKLVDTVNQAVARVTVSHHRRFEPLAKVGKLQKCYIISDRKMVYESKR